MFAIEQNSFFIKTDSMLRDGALYMEQQDSMWWSWVFIDIECEIGVHHIYKYQSIQPQTPCKAKHLHVE